MTKREVTICGLMKTRVYIELIYVRSVHINFQKGSASNCVFTSSSVGKAAFMTKHELSPKSN